MMMEDPKNIIATGILIAGVIDDIKTRKVHNTLVLLCIVIALIGVFSIHGTSGILLGFSGLLTAFVILIPFVLLKIIGAGDMKLLMAFGILVPWKGVITTILLSFVWGALLGVLSTILNKNLGNLFSNLKSIALNPKKTPSLELTQIPFTVALLFGWFSHLTLSHIGRPFL